MQNPTFPARNMVSISMHFFAENLQRKRTILLSSRSIAVLVRLFKRTQVSPLLSESQLGMLPQLGVVSPPGQAGG
jgi:hypothetical protein